MNDYNHDDENVIGLRRRIKPLLSPSPSPHRSPSPYGHEMSSSSSSSSAALPFSANYNVLDGDLTYEIFSFLDTQSLVCASRVCSWWLKEARDPVLWEKLYNVDQIVRGPLNRWKESQLKRVIFTSPKMVFTDPILLIENISKNKTFKYKIAQYYNFRRVHIQKDKLARKLYAEYEKANKTIATTCFTGLILVPIFIFWQIWKLYDIYMQTSLEEFYMYTAYYFDPNLLIYFYSIFATICGIGFAVLHNMDRPAVIYTGSVFLNRSNSDLKNIYSRIFSFIFNLRNLYSKVLYGCALTCLSYKLIYSEDPLALLSACEVETAHDISLYWTVVVFLIKLDQTLDVIVFMLIERANHFMFYRSVLLPILPWVLYSLDPGYRFCVLLLNIIGGWRIPQLVRYAQGTTVIFTLIRLYKPCQGYHRYDYLINLLLTLLSILIFVIYRYFFNNLLDPGERSLSHVMIFRQGRRRRGNSLHERARLRGDN